MNREMAEIIRNQTPLTRCHPVRPSRGSTCTRTGSVPCWSLIESLVGIFTGRDGIGSRQDAGATLHHVMTKDPHLPPRHTAIHARLMRWRLPSCPVVHEGIMIGTFARRLPTPEQDRQDEETGIWERAVALSVATA